MATTRLLIFQGEEDISDEVELKNVRSNPFGGSQGEIWHNARVNGAIIPEKIGWLYCGEPELNEGYTFKIEKIVESDFMRCPRR